MSNNDSDGDTLALMALSDPGVVVEARRKQDPQELRFRQSVEALSNTGLLRALRSTTAPKLDDLRRLSELIRKERKQNPKLGKR